MRERSSSWLLPVGAGLAVLALVVVLAKGTLGTVHQPEPVAATPPPSPSVPAATMPTSTAAAIAPEPRGVEAPAPERRDVQITVRTIPPNASVQIDDGEPVSAPYTLETPSSSIPRTIRASAPNYASVTRKVIFDQPREIVLQLSPLQSSRKPRRGPRAEPSATPSVDLAPVTPREPGTLPPKRPRPLDEDNPFAG